MFVRIGTQTVSLTVGTVPSTWSFAAVHVVKRSSTQSQVCVKLNTVAMTCSNLNAVLTDTGTMKTRIGRGFRGTIRELIVLATLVLYALEKQVFSA